MPARFADATRARAAALAFDLRQLPAEYYVNPYPTYHALRQYAPVHRLADGGYFVSRYADCVALYLPSPPIRNAILGALEPVLSDARASTANKLSQAS